MRRLILWCLFVVCSLLSSPALGRSELSEMAQLIKIELARPASDAPVREWATHEALIWKSAQEAAKDIFSRYLSGEWTAADSAALESCTFSHPKLIRLVETALGPTIKAQSNEILKSSSSSYLRKLAKALDERLDVPFNFARRGAAGGYHRGRNSIFLDFTVIPRTEWFVVYIHEATHALDSELQRAVEVYSDKSLVEMFAKELPNVSRASEFSAEAARALETWLLAGLSRGMLAEYRAWLVTSALYREAIAASLSSKVPWMEDILADSSHTLSEIWLRKIDKGFKNPNSGIFKHSAVEEALNRIRMQIAIGRIPVSLGSLAQFVPAY